MVFCNVDGGGKVGGGEKCGRRVVDFWETVMYNGEHRDQNKNLKDK